jgi:hypothetical protein
LTSGVAGQRQLLEDRVDVALDRALVDAEPLGDRNVARPSRHLDERLALVGGEVGEQRGLRIRSSSDERVDDLRVDERSAGHDRLDRRQELARAVQALLEEVPAPVGTGLEQGERVGRVVLVAQRDDGGLGMRLAQLRRQLEAFVGHRRRHRDLGQDDVRAALA